jgi:hypothetical protein
MVINNKVQKDSKLVRTAVKNLGQFKFSSQDPEIYDEFDPETNYSIIVPFRDSFLLVEVSDLDDNLKISLKLTGIISKEDLCIGLKINYFSDIISVGEITLYENVIVAYCEHLRMNMSNYKSKNVLIDTKLFNIRDLEIICSKALKWLICERIFVTDKDFYINGELPVDLLYNY